jgi:hypothetical protein
MEVELLSGQRQKSESDKAVIACNDFLRMGVGRSLAELANKYREMPQNTAATDSINTLQGWSKRFGWSERAAEYDRTWEDRKNREREAVMNYGLALDYERVLKLYRLAGLLESQIYEKSEAGIYHNIWMPDVKQIGSGQDAERVDLEKFNAPLLEQYRKTLDDIAAETGGRIKKQDITSGGKALPITIVRMDLDEI